MIEQTRIENADSETASPEPRAGLSDALIASVLAAGALIVYVLTLCPTIFADDCGEIATAVATGGVMHPPGYPLYTLLGRAFIAAIPWGEPAHRLGLLSCVCAAGAVAGTYSLARRAGAGQAWSAGGALAFAFSYTLWQQATKVETYALNALFVSLLLWLAVTVNRTASAKSFLTMAFVGGLALTNHLTIVWLIPALAYLAVPALAARHGRQKAIGLIAAAAVVCVLPLPLYLTEIVAARTHPGGQVWGDPSTLHRFWLHVTGARYHELFGISSMSYLYQRDVVFMPSWLWRNLYAMLPLAILGLAALLRAPSRRSIGVGLAIGVVSYLACNTVYRILNIFEYYTSTVLMLAVLGAVGGETIIGWVSAKLGQGGSVRAGGLMSATAVVFVSALPLALNWSACDRSQADAMRLFAENNLNSVPPNSVIVATGDNIVFPLWYAQEVLRERPDVTVLPRNMLLHWDTDPGRQMTAWCAQRIQREHPEVDANALLSRAAADPTYARSGGALWDMIRNALNRGQAVYFTDAMPGDLAVSGPTVNGNRPLAALPDYTLVHEGILDRMVPLQAQPTIAERLQREQAVEKTIKYDYVRPELFQYEPDLDITNHKYAFALNKTAVLLVGAKQYAAAYDRANRAVVLDPKLAPAWNTYAVACVTTGRTADALAAWQKAVALDPANAEYRRNLATAQATGAGKGAK